MERRGKSRKAILRHQVAAGRCALLAVTGLTLVNLILLICKAEYHFLLSGAVPYYVNWLCAKLDSAWIWLLLAAILSVGLTVLYGACWVLSQRRRIFLTAAVGFYALDTLLLVIFAFTLVGNPASCALEVLTHLAVLALLAVSERAAGEMQRMRRRPRISETV
jgi:hypothetical protein